MRLSVRRFEPGATVASFLGLLDIKLGCEIILLFGLINKVAGVYGLITIFVGGSFLQFLFYAYSVGTLFVALWALGVIKSESAHSSLLVAHLYAADHAILSLFHYLFYLHYWYVVPHDGRRAANSQAQQDIVDLAASRGEISDVGTHSGEALDELRAALAGEIWQREKGYALGVVLFGWALKIYFILVLYSYAAHLRQSSYHGLPLSARPKQSTSTSVYNPVGDGDEHELDHADFATPRPSDVGVDAAKSVHGGAGSEVGEGGASGKGSGSGSTSGGVGSSKAAAKTAREGRPNVETVDEEDFSWD